jgi:hypothetical protein
MYPEITLKSEFGDVKLYFWPNDVIRVHVLHSTNLILFELKLENDKYVYNSGAMDSFVNCEMEKYQIIGKIEKLVNEWLQDNLIEKFKINMKIIQEEIINGQNRIPALINQRQQMISDIQKEIESIHKTIEADKHRLLLMQKELLDAEKISLQKKE